MKPFLLFDTNDSDRVICYASEAGLNILRNCPGWHCDATFATAPAIYYQVLSIHAFIKNRTLPVVFIYMKNKDMICYKKVLELFKNTCHEKYRIVFNPASVMCDFEQALFKAFLFHFPKINISGCYFHFVQCIWKKVILKVINHYIVVFISVCYF